MIKEPYQSDKDRDEECDVVLVAHSEHAADEKSEDEARHVESREGYLLPGDLSRYRLEICF